MRTRFLATDYFAPSSSSSSSSGQALVLECFSFPSLTIPALPPDPHFLPFTTVAELPAATVASDGLDYLPIASALSDFLAAVIPQALPVPIVPSAGEVLDDFLYDRVGDGEGLNSWESTAFEASEGYGVINCEKDEKADGSRSEGPEISTVMKRWGPLKEIRFEVVEVDLLTALQEDIASFGEESSGGGVTLLFRVPDMKIHLDFIDIDTDTKIRYQSDLAESVYQVEKIPLKDNDGEERSSMRDFCCLEIAALDHGVAIPRLEASRNSWELDDCLAETDRSNVFHNVVRHLDEAHIQHPVFKSTEFLRSADMDMLTFVCGDVPYHDIQVDKPTTVKAAVEMDLVRINDNILLEKNSELYPLKPDGTCSDLPCSIHLEEMQIIDFPSDDVFKMLVQSETAKMNISDEIFKDDFDPARRLYELMVSSELALVDDTFRSLPTPILNDDIAVRSMVPPIQEILCSLKPHPLSATDGIYLDWHLLLEEPCNREICCSYASMVEEVKACLLSFELQRSCQGTLVFDSDFLLEFQRSSKLQDVDKFNNIYIPAPLSHDPQKLEATQKCVKEGGTRSRSNMEEVNPEKSSSFPQSISQSNDLNFYFNVRSGSRRETNYDNTSSLDIPPSKEQAFSFSTRDKVDKLIEIHPVNPSNLIRGLIEQIHASYTSALQESTYWRHSFSDGQCLGISKHKLLELITGEGSEGLHNDCEHKDKMELIVLYALKQVAYYLCFFGLHAANLYISNLTGSFESTPERLKHIQCSISEAQTKSEKQLLESHPSLSYIETILRSNKQTGLKILIVADRAFWLPLGQKLTSMKMTFVEFGKNPAKTYVDLVNKTNSTTWVLEELLKSDCILLDNKNIPASFPFDEFGIILEYGGPNKSSTLLSLAPKLDGLPPLHFLYVKVDSKDFPVALVEDNHKDQDLKSTLEKVLLTLQKDLQEKMNKMRIVDSLNFIPATNQLQGLQEKVSKHFAADFRKELLPDDQWHGLQNLKKKNTSDSHNFVLADEQQHIHQTMSNRPVVNSENCVPAVEKSSSTSSVSATVLKDPQENQSTTDLPYSAKNGSIMTGRLSVPEVVIVVNTVNHGKTMLVSRRSSYQQILALEKGGMHVVERDIDLPVDIILSSAVCLVWYETMLFESNEPTTSEETSGINFFVESIATNILMSVSFSFTGCIMVFEGEAHFLSAVMDSSDSLYAAAASLDMNLQLFFSHTPKLTDEIIHNCIMNVTSLNKAPSADVPESETLAESFLTSFPSINPLSAYMILSSGDSLVEFLSWPHERRIQKVEKYLLSPKIISLFNALCKFGELGESRSVMTECSSVDSDISSALLQSPRKRKKRASQAFAVPTSDLFSESLNQMPGDYAEHAEVFTPSKLRKFCDMDNAIRELPDVFTFDQSLNMGSDGFSYQQKKHGVDAIPGNHIIDDDFSNGLTPNIRAYNRSDNMVDTFNFPCEPEFGGKHHTSPTNRPSFSRTHSNPVFSTALEINGDPGERNISGGTKQTWKGLAHGGIADDSYRYDMDSKYQETRDEIVQPPASSLALQKLEFGSHATSQGSCWEIDYLRQMSAKRKARQERSRCNNSAMSNPRMWDGNSKILSPPIESFRYRDRDTPSRDQSPSIGTQHYGKGKEGAKTHNRRARKDFNVQPTITHKKRIEPSIDPTWTPIDKRARQKLSFVTYGKEKQSKLVWRNQNSPGVGCGFRKRFGEEGT
uniref:Protein SHORTAGE IN CHIASMATA 1 n=1 Tax=Oryza brachyantha TaxID=4533 RepID=J3LF84_ORYBR